MAISDRTPTYNGGTLTGTEPAGTSQGDVLVAWMLSGEHTAQTGPAGWTQIDQLDGSGPGRVSAWWILRGASAPALTWAGPTASATSIEVMCFTGQDQAQSIEVVAAAHAIQQQSGDSTPDSPSVTTQTDNSWLVCCWGADADPVSSVQPTGMTSIFSRPSGDWFAGARLLVTPAGATGLKNWTLGASPNTLHCSFVVRLSGTPIVPATRFRLPSSGTPEVSPAIQSYTHTGGTARPLPLTDTSTLTTVALAPDAADHIAAGDTYFFQGVSGRLAGQVIASGVTVKLAIQTLEAHVNNNLFLQLWVGIVSPTGTALQTLLAKTADNTELIATIQNRFMSPTTTAGYTCMGGERLVVEISVTGTPVATSGTQGHNASLRFGGSGAGGDNGENDTDTGATLNPWIEFNPGVLFEVPDQGTPFGARGENQMQQLLAT